jgi:hypothetical protein
VAVILAVLFFIGGAWAAGLAAVKVAIEAAKAGKQVDWDKLRRDVSWLMALLWDAKEGVRKAFVAGALAYPMTKDLGVSKPATDTSGWPLCKVTEGPSGYPFRMDGRDEVKPGLLAKPEVDDVQPDLNFDYYPGFSDATPDPSVNAVKGELPPTIGWHLDGERYPSHVLEGMGLLNGGMLFDNGAFPTRGESFGDAVSNAVQLVQSEAQGLVDYNLDGDRGYGYKTWLPAPDTKPKDGKINEEPQP